VDGELDRDVAPAVDRESAGPAGGAPEVAGAWIPAHLDDCARCRRLVRSHRQVKQRTAGLRTLPVPPPGQDLVDRLLRVPAAEHTRDRTRRCATGPAGWSRVTGVAVGALAGTGLVAAAWMAPVGTAAVGGSGSGQLSPGQPAAVVPTTGAPTTAAPAGVPTAPPTLARWSPADD